jgi:glycosyltransferase involved in cell wall biosynthesis
VRVAIVGSYPLDSSRVEGGVQSAFAYLVNGLRQIDDLKLHILTFGGRSLRQSDRLEQGGITFHLLPRFPRFELAKNFRTYQAVLNQELAQVRPDVVHAQDATDHAYVALRSGYPAVVTVHGVRREDGKYVGSWRVRLRNALYSMLIERSIMRNTRHLIAISRYVTAYYAKLLRPDVQVYHVPNAIDAAFFDLAKNANGAGTASPTILFAGRVIPRKRALDLVQAFARLAPQAPSAQLRIAGEYSSEKEYAAAVRQVIQNANLAGRVHLLGPLPETEVLAEFAACDVLALPSAQETTPMVIAQAMAAGKPVVATPVGGVAEMVSDGETGRLVQVGDIDGLANALLCLLQNPSLRATLGRAAYQFAAENYRADAVAQRTYDVYQKIAGVRR